MKKVILSVIAIPALLLFVIINFSVITTRYECSGDFVKSEVTKKITVFLKLEDFRWWVNLWKKQNHDAVIWVEVPNTFYTVYHNIGKAEDFYLIYENNQTQLGKFSILSKNLIINYHEGTFSGQCKKLN